MNLQLLPDHVAHLHGHGGELLPRAQEEVVDELLPDHVAQLHGHLQVGHHPDWVTR